MGSKSTHQFPLLTDLRPDDLVYVVRPSGGNYLDRSAPVSLFAPHLFRTDVIIPSADVLALYDVPVELVPAPNTDQMIIVRQSIVTQQNSTVDYTSNNILIGGNTIDSSNFIMINSMPSAANPVINMQPFYAGTSIYQGISPGAALRITIDGGNPTTGDGDLRVITFYYLIDV